MSQQALADAMRELGHKWSQATVWSVERGNRPLRLVEANDLRTVLADGRYVDFSRPPEAQAVAQEQHRFYGLRADLIRRMADYLEGRWILAVSMHHLMEEHPEDVRVGDYANLEDWLTDFGGLLSAVREAEEEFGKRHLLSSDDEDEIVKMRTERLRAAEDIDAEIREWAASMRDKFEANRTDGGGDDGEHPEAP